METTHVTVNRKIVTPLAAFLIILAVLAVAAVAVFSLLSNSTGGEVISSSLSEPIGTAKTAKLDINRYSGDLTIDRQAGNEQLLASGALPYLDTQELARSADTSSSQGTLTLKTSARQTGFRLPWVGCTDETQWQVHLNPLVAYDITAYSGGGEINLDLTGLTVTKVAVDLGGGNITLALPENATYLNVTATTGAGSVEIRLPEGTAARIIVTTGMGEAAVDERFTKVDDKTYQSAGYDSAASKVEITANSGAGNVTITTK